MDTPTTHAECLKFWRQLEHKMHPSEWRKFTDAQYQKCKSDYLYWRQSALFCFSTDKDVGTMPMPCKPYNLWIHSYLENPTLKSKFFPKTRQMMISWEIAAYVMWFGQFHEDAESLVMNKQESESAYMVAVGRGKHGNSKGRSPGKGRGRIWTLYRNQPDWLKERCPAQDSYNLVDWHYGGVVQGMPQGEEQFQGHQPGLVWIDEAGFVDGFEAHYFACLPMVEVVIVSSTPNGPDQYYRQVMDRQETFGVN